MRRLPSWCNYKDKPQRKGPQSESQKFFFYSIVESVEADSIRNGKAKVLMFTVSEVCRKRACRKWLQLSSKQK